MYFNANDRLVSFLSTMRTLPKAPRPTTRNRRKWLRFTGRKGMRSAIEPRKDCTGQGLETHLHRRTRRVSLGCYPLVADVWRVLSKLRDYQGTGYADILWLPCYLGERVKDMGADTESTRCGSSPKRRYANRAIRRARGAEENELQSGSQVAGSSESGVDSWSWSRLLAFRR